MKISVLGSGGWGIAIAIMLSDNSHCVTLWSHSVRTHENLIKHRQNSRLLPGAIISQAIDFTTDIAACTDADLIVLAVPSFAMRETAQKLSHFVSKNSKILSVSKGLEMDTCLTLSQVIKSEIDDCDIAVMSGPNHAEEIAIKFPSATVVATQNRDFAKYIQNIFMNSYFRIYTSDDIMGLEIGGALKNVIALCCGISNGLGYGDNTKAAIITRGIVEITNLGAAMGAQSQTFSGLSGIGDLIVTCTSLHSRNLRAGILIGQGMSVYDAQSEIKMTVEGIQTTQIARRLAFIHNVQMPIVEQAHGILFEDLNARDAVKNLMGRCKKDEIK